MDSNPPNLSARPNKRSFSQGRPCKIERMKIISWLPCVLLAIFCSSCQTRKIISERDVSFGTADGQTLLLDVCRPEESVSKPRPAVILVHGGGWGAGDKKDFFDAAKGLARHGYVAFSVNYRLAANGRNLWPAQLDDVQRAVRWVRAHADKYGVDPKRVGALGHSAGGHLVACLATRETRDNSDRELASYSSRVTCAVDASGPVDLVTVDTPQTAGIIANLLGATPAERPDLARDASPIRFVDDKTAPVLIVHGRIDNLVAVRHAEQFDAALRKAGVESKLLIFDGEGHGITNRSHAFRFIWMTLNFLNGHLNP